MKKELTPCPELKPHRKLNREKSFQILPKHSLSKSFFKKGATYVQSTDANCVSQ
jgi:hypothetical protein